MGLGSAVCLKQAVCELLYISERSTTVDINTDLIFSRQSELFGPIHMGQTCYDMLGNVWFMHKSIISRHYTHI